MTNKQHACSKYSDMYPLTVFLLSDNTKPPGWGIWAKTFCFLSKTKTKKRRRKIATTKFNLVQVCIIYNTPTVQSALYQGFWLVWGGKPAWASPVLQIGMHCITSFRMDILWPIFRNKRTTCRHPSGSTDTDLQDKHALTTFTTDILWPSSGSTRAAHWPLQDQQALTYFQDEHTLTFMINMPRPILGSTGTDLLQDRHALAYVQDQHALTYLQNQQILYTDSFRTNTHWHPSVSQTLDKKENNKEKGPTLPSGLLRSIVIIITMQLLLF